jgi:hypothetical protein
LSPRENTGGDIESEMRVKPNEAHERECVTRHQTRNSDVAADKAIKRRRCFFIA